MDEASSKVCGSETSLRENIGASRLIYLYFPRSRIVSNHIVISRMECLFHGSYCPEAHLALSTASERGGTFVTAFN